MTRRGFDGKWQGIYGRWRRFYGKWREVHVEWQRIHSEWQGSYGRWRRFYGKWHLTYGNRGAINGELLTSFTLGETIDTASVDGTVGLGSVRERSRDTRSVAGEDGC